MPTRPVRASNASRFVRQRASGTITSPSGGIAGAVPSAASSSRSQGSGASFLSLMMIAIHAFLEWIETGAPHDVDEALFGAFAPLQIDLDQLLDDIGNLRPRERGSDHLSHRGGRAGTGQPLVAADGNLVPLLAVLVHAEDADVADVVVAAGVHAPGDVEVELADIVDIVEIVKALLYRLRHRDRLGVGERAEIAARAGDDVGDRP